MDFEQVREKKVRHCQARADLRTGMPTPSGLTRRHSRLCITRRPAPHEAATLHDSYLTNGELNHAGQVLVEHARAPQDR